uniref:F-box domain-containing protein n=1 Tax=Caenorhabditis tropicalis TaxID=1561998 RepID=A0A1I7V2K1_9PELO
MTFLLFRLPSVALREALTHLQLDDLFVLSLCSQKTNRLIKSHYKKGSNSKMWLTSAGDLPMVVSSLGSLEITVLVTERRIWANSENVEIGGQKMVLIQVINYDTHEEGRVPFEVLCAGQRQGFKAVVDHIRDLILPDLDSIDVNPPFLWMLEVVEDPFKSGNIRSRRTLYQAEVPFSEEEVQCALDTCNSSDIRFKPLLSAGFVFSGSFKNDSDILFITRIG